MYILNLDISSIAVLGIILSSAVIAAFVSSITTYLIEKRKYKQEYWKISIDKRLNANEEIEKLLIYFQSIHYVGNKPCHLGFSSVDAINQIQVKLAAITWKRSWIATNVYNRIIDLNRLLAQCELGSDEIVEKFGVDNYFRIAALRDQILIMMADDYSNLSNIKKFFKAKVSENKKLAKELLK